ncbi:MAG: hypothetical protein FWC90_01945 [Oscillospiraceae bacterium]|nr:hypothetical protein [Oscillospiraceae bacterium]
MDNLSFDSEKFTAVWQRVTESKSGTVPNKMHKTRDEIQTESDRLCRMMDILAQDAECLRILSRKCHPRARDTLQRMTRENLRTLKNLRVRYFILTGGSYSPACECQPFHTVSERLRMVHINAVSLADKFTSAAKNHKNVTYNEFAKIKTRHAEIITCLIGNMMNQTYSHPLR